MAKLYDRVALVTGSGRGIGREIAMQLASEGAKVVVNDLDEGPALETIEAIKKAGGEAVACVGSVTDKEFPKRLIDTAMENYGDIHIIVNNAGYTWDATIQKMTDEQFDAITDVHLRAPWRILKEAAEIIRIKSKGEAERGERVMRKVVNISSVAGSRGNPGQTNYASAKAALIGLSKTLAKEWGRYNVCVNAVAFGMIETRLTEGVDEKTEIEIEGKTVPIGIPKEMVAGATSMIPLGRAGTPAEGAGGVVILCLPESDYVSGQLLEVTGGY